MLNENIVLGLLQASITGAGLVLTVYALLIPVARQIFQNRTSELKQFLEHYKKESKKLEEKISKGKIPSQTTQEIKVYLYLIERKMGLPDYMRKGMLSCFIGYISSVLMSLLWLLDWYKPMMDAFLPWFFMMATFAFLLVGINAIIDIYLVFKKEYDDSLKSEINKEKDMLET